MAVVNPKSRRKKQGRARFWSRAVAARWNISAMLLFVGTATMILLLFLFRGGTTSAAAATVTSDHVGDGSNNNDNNIRKKQKKNPLSFSKTTTTTTATHLLPETIRLRSSGLDMPAIGYGTCCRPSAKGDAIYESTKLFLKHGGRLIDTAMAYDNHAEIGRAIADFNEDIPRSELWITSKIAPNRVRTYGDCLLAVDDILSELNTPYLDLLLIHSPKLGREATTDLWRCLIEAKRLEKTRAIGVSNFNRGEIEDIAHATGDTWPDANEIQQHPWSSKAWKDLAAWQKERGIATIAYTSLGGSRFHNNGAAADWPAKVTELAAAHGVTEAQVMLRWALQKRIAVIPGSGSEKHIVENLRVPVFELSPRDVSDLEDARAAPPSWFDPRRGPNKYGDVEATTPWITANKKKKKNKI